MSHLVTIPIAHTLYTDLDVFVFFFISKGIFLGTKQ